MSWSGTVHCGHCYKEGHNKRSCPTLKEYVEQNPDSYRAQSYNRSKQEGAKRRCGYCSESGHNRKTCVDYKKDFADAVKLNASYRERIAEHLKKIGLGIGALVTANAGWKTDNEDCLMMVTHILWHEMNFDGLSDDWKGDVIIAQQLSKMGSDVPMSHGHRIRIPLNDIFDEVDLTSSRTRLIRIDSPVSSELADEQIPGWFVHREDSIKEMWKTCTKQTNHQHARDMARKILFNSNDSEEL